MECFGPGDPTTNHSSESICEARFMKYELDNEYKRILDEYILNKREYFMYNGLTSIYYLILKDC